jgi:hypothetical protein
VAVPRGFSEAVVVVGLALLPPSRPVRHAHRRRQTQQERLHGVAEADPRHLPCQDRQRHRGAIRAPRRADMMLSPLECPTMSLTRFSGTLAISQRLMNAPRNSRAAPQRPATHPRLVACSPRVSRAQGCCGATEARNSVVLPAWRTSGISTASLGSIKEQAR